MKKSNAIAIVCIVIAFFVANYAYSQYEERKGEKYIPNRFHSTTRGTPTSSPNGLLYMDGCVWVSSPKDKALLKYDLSTRVVVESLPVPCFEVAGIAYDGEAFWVADYSRKTIHRISPEGEVLSSYETPYSTPYGVAWDGQTVWVLDVYGIENSPEMTGSGKDYPNSRIYKFDLETGEILEAFEAPADHCGDITYKDGEIFIAGDRKVFCMDIRTKRIKTWYYAPDNLPRGVAVRDDTTHFVSGMDVRNIWEIDLTSRMQLKDIRKEHDVFAPFWLVIIAAAVMFPIVLDEWMHRDKKYKDI